MSKLSRCDNPPEIKVVNRVRVDVRRQRQRVADEAVFELGDEVALPAQALDLPRAEGESCDGDDGEEDEARAVAAL